MRAQSIFLLTGASDVYIHLNFPLCSVHRQATTVIRIVSPVQRVTTGSGRPRLHYIPKAGSDPDRIRQDGLTASVNAKRPGQTRVGIQQFQSTFEEG